MPEAVAVPFRARVVRVLDVKLGRLDLRVRAPDGSPAAHARLSLVGRGSRIVELAADGEGRVRKGPLAAGSYRVRVWPRRLGDPEERDAHFREHGAEATERLQLDAGVVEVAPGEDGRVIELRLPPAWSR